MNIPTIHAKGNCLLGAWEQAVLGVWHMGIDVKTEYDYECPFPLP